MDIANAEPMKGGARLVLGPDRTPSLSRRGGGGLSAQPQRDSLRTPLSFAVWVTHGQRAYKIASSRVLPDYTEVYRGTGLRYTIRYLKVPVELQLRLLQTNHVLYTCVCGPVDSVASAAARRALAAAGIVPPNASSDVGKDKAPLVAASPCQCRI